MLFYKKKYIYVYFFKTSVVGRDCCIAHPKSPIGVNWVEM